MTRNKDLRYIRKIPVTEYTNTGTYYDMKGRLMKTDEIEFLKMLFGDDDDQLIRLN